MYQNKDVTGSTGKQRFKEILTSFKKIAPLRVTSIPF